MKIRFGDVGDESASRESKIRMLFVSGRTVKAHADKCIQEKVWTESELYARAMRACRAEVREALGSLVEGGVPFAGPTRPKGKGAPAWKQLEFWTKEDYVYNFNAYACRGGQNVTVANNIARAYGRVYGDGGPKMLRIAEMEEVA